MPRSTSPADEEPLLSIARRRAVTKARAEVVSRSFGRLLFVQATGAAGDALVALALAGSLFFSVPEATARGRVALYLLLTVAPFAVVAPFLSRGLDRHPGSMRVAITIAAAGRTVLAWLLATRIDSLLLFPLAFGVLVLSRAALVVRGAILPGLVPDGASLVQANSTLSKVSAVAGMLVVLPGLALLQVFSTRAEVLFAALVYATGIVPAIGLPAPERRRAGSGAAGRFAPSVAVRQGVVATAGIRLLVGFLVFHLAFAFRREELGSIGLGLLIASAAVGTLAGAVAAPRMRRRLREEGILAFALMGAGITGVVVGRWFSVLSAAVLVLVFGIASGAAKVAFDAVVQRDVPEDARGRAFARFESLLQITWVAGAAIPLVAPIPSGVGTAAAGVASMIVAGIFIGGRRRARARALP